MSNSKTKAVAVTVASSIHTPDADISKYTRERVIEWAGRAIKYGEDSAKCKQLVMYMLAEEFGKDAVRPYDGGKGGINCNSFKANSSLDTMQNEAGRLDIPLAKAQELAGIIAEIRTMGERSWQEFQRTMFGRREVILSSVPVTSIAGQALAVALEEKTVASNVKKVAKAQLDIAKVQGGDVVSAQSAFDTANQQAIIAKENAEIARGAAKLEADKKNAAKSLDNLSDAIQIAIDLATKQGRNVIADKLAKILLLVA